MSCRQEGYVPPKRPYSFEAMLDDILAFAAMTLVDDGMLSLWMPTANEEEMELGIPLNPYLKIESVCTQVFNKCKAKHHGFDNVSFCVVVLMEATGSRRLLTYRRLRECEVTGDALPKARDIISGGKTADDLNSFRRQVSTCYSLAVKLPFLISRLSTFKALSPNSRKIHSRMNSTIVLLPQCRTL